MWTPSKKYNSNSSFTREKTTASKTPTQTHNYQEDKPLNRPNNLPKPKQRTYLLSNLQEIYAMLNFNNSYETFPQEELAMSKHKVQSMINRVKKDSDGGCPIHPNETLNLYCQKDKALLCILCVHRDNMHKDKSHNVVPVSSVEFQIKNQIGRLRDRIENMIFKLNDWENRLHQKIEQLGQVCSKISNITQELFQSLREQITMNQKSFAKTLLQNQVRASKIMELYHQKIESLNKSYGQYILDMKGFELIDQLNILKVVDSELVVSQKLLKKAYDTLTVFPIWNQIQGALSNMKKSWEIESRSVNQKLILVTQF